MIQTKSETKRELVETLQDRGQSRPMLIRISAGHVYAKPKGTRDPWVLVSIAGAYRHAQTVAADLPGRVLGMAERGRYKR